MCFGPEKYASGVWFSARAAKSSVAAFETYDPRTDYRSGTEIDKQCCFDEMLLYKTLHAHTNIMTTNFLFLPIAVLLFTFPPLKPRTLKHPNQIYANKRNSFMV